jgi:hypothetical protein
MTFTHDQLHRLFIDLNVETFLNLHEQISKYILYIKFV